MGWFSKVFGGGSTKVNTSNQTTVKTDVKIDLSNIIDMSGLERAIDEIGQFFMGDAARNAATTAQFKDLLVQQGVSDASFKTALLQQGEDQKELTKNQQTLLLLNTAVEADRNQQIAEANKTFRIAALAGGAIGVYYLFMRK